MCPCPAAWTAWMRLRAASEEGRSLERWEPDHDDRHRGVLHHEGQDRGGVAHDIGAVTHHDAVGPGLDLLADGLGEDDEVLLRHVLGEDTEELLGSEVGEVRELRHRAVELAGGEGGDDRAGAVVEARSDGASGAQEGDLRQVLAEGELLVRDLVDRLLVPDLHELGHAVDVQADVVAGLQLQDEVLVVEGLAPGKDDPLEDAAGVVGGAHVAPHPDLPPLEAGPGAPLVALERVLGGGHLSASSLSFSASSTVGAGTRPRRRRITTPAAWRARRPGSSS